MKKKDKIKDEVEVEAVFACDEIPVGDPRNLDVVYSLNNHLYYYRDIDSEGAALFCKTLTEMYYNMISSMLATGLKDPVIEIHINSGGGEAFSAFAMAAKIEEIKKGFGPIPVPMKVITHTEGEASSGGSFISVVGSERTITKYSVILIHNALGGVAGSLETMRDQVKNVDTLTKNMRDLYKNNSKLTDAELDEILIKDIYFDAEKCLEVGLVDRIV